MNHTETEKIGAVLIVGAGISGMQSALDLANAGFKVYLADRNVSIGGVMAQLDKTFPTNDCSTCLISPKLIEVASNPNIELLTRSRVTGISGDPGHFVVQVHQDPRFIREEACTGCGECIKVCPIEVPSDFNQGLNRRKAIYRHFPQAVPSTFAIDRRGTSPCKATCPAHVSVQGFIALINQKKYREALALFKEAHPFPGICGRVCHHPCEGICTRGDLDQPLSIQYLHRFLADEDLAQAERHVPEVKERKTEKIAVIGSGPAGLGAAYFLARDGYPVTVYEKLPVAGGMMAVGIPEYRLPREILRSEIQTIEALGVEIKTGVTFGQDITLDSLKAEGFQAFFLATGLHVSRGLNVEGEDLPGVLQGVEFLKDSALKNPVSLGQKVLVIGGGNVAVDVALSAKRLGAGQVTLICLEKREEMPAWDYEIEEALEEGIEIVNSLGPKRFLQEGGQVSGIEFKRCTAVFDAQGAFRPTYDENDLTTLTGDTVIVAIGQAADLSFAAGQGVAVTPRGGLQGDPVSLETPIPGVFCGGDVFYGPKSVVEAVESGKKAAESIRRYLNGEDLKAGREEDWSYEKPSTEGVVKKARLSITKLPPAAREGNFQEVAQGFQEATALTEAERCLECGICSECYQCVQVCLAKAIDHTMTGRDLTLEVGAVVACPGFEIFDARLKEEYGYGRYPNVLTSLEFERVLSASGPFGGHVQRPSDGREPRKVAWIQCVGSRDASLNREYCSYVCCMYATKQAIIAKEHVAAVEPTIFFIDIRAQGKGFDRYYERAKNEHGVRYIRSLISRVAQDPRTQDLQISYIDEDDQFQTETFDLVILSVGLQPHSASRELADILGIETDRFGFCEYPPLDTVGTSRPGIFTGGVFQNPKDIPETVTQASGAAAAAGAILSEARGTRIREQTFPEERPVQGEEPRIGVFICHCGINIAGIVDVEAVSAYARTLPGVVYTDHLLFTCSTDSQVTMLNLIRDQGLNRVVVASCSPRTHEGLFRNTLRQAGLNKYLFEMANIRDQCSWVHQADPGRATEKAKDLVRMAVARARLLDPLYEIPFEVDQRALVLGGGLSGLTAALNLAEQGFETFLIERSGELGGMARRIYRTIEGVDVQDYLQRLISQVKSHPRVRLFTETELLETTGHVGRFTSVFSSRGEKGSVDHGVMLVATGGSEYKPGEYAYGRHPGILTQLELEDVLYRDPQKIREARQVVMIQCVGSREEDHPYCSRVCCSTAVANALKIKAINPRTEVIVLYRDIRTYARKELYYKQAREAGVRFIRFDPEKQPEVEIADGRPGVTVFDQNLKAGLRLQPDFIALSAAIRPAEGSKPLAQLLKLPLDADGFFLEAHIKLRPLDFANAGMFLCGLGHGPKSMEESLAQAKGAAARAATILSQKLIYVGGPVAEVNEDLCVACLTCVRVCPFNVPRINERHFAQVDPAACQGCGNCASACPQGAIQVGHFQDDQYVALVEAC